MALDGASEIRFLIHDRDAKFYGPFDEVFSSDGIGILKTPIRARRVNAMAERCVKTVKDRVPGLDADPRRASPRRRAQRVCRALQRLPPTVGSSCAAQYRMAVPLVRSPHVRFAAEVGSEV
jgi:hypothetical protein